MWNYGEPYSYPLMPPGFAREVELLGKGGGDVRAQAGLGIASTAAVSYIATIVGVAVDDKG